MTGVRSVPPPPPTLRPPESPDTSEEIVSSLDGPEDEVVTSPGIDPARAQGASSGRSWGIAGLIAVVGGVGLYLAFGPGSRREPRWVGGRPLLQPVTIIGPTSPTGASGEAADPAAASPTKDVSDPGRPGRKGPAIVRLHPPPEPRGFGRRAFSTPAPGMPSWGGSPAPGGADSSSAGSTRWESTGGGDVTMYSTSWCPVCRRARDWLRENGVTYTEHDVQADLDARARFAQINPSGGVPTFVVGHQTLVGFSPEALRGALLRAGRRF